MTAYEIRARMIELAQDYLNKQFELNKQIAEQTFHQLTEAGKQAGKVTDYWPQLYTPEQVLEQAQKLYKFVSDVR